MRGCTPWVIPWMGMVTICMTLWMMVRVPTYRSPPYRCRPEFSTTVTRLSVDCMMKGATPRPAIRETTARRRRMYCGRMRRPERRLHRNSTTQAALTAWDRMVARAAPRTPMSKTKMNTGSSTMFRIAPMSTEHIAVMARPWALMKVFRPRASWTKTVPSR